MSISTNTFSILQLKVIKSLIEKFGGGGGGTAEYPPNGQLDDILAVAVPGATPSDPPIAVKWAPPTPGPQGPQGEQGEPGEVLAYVFDGGTPSTTFVFGPGFDCGGVS